MLIKIYPDHPQPRQILRIVETLKNGGVIIYPTDTVYGFGCDIYNQKAVERICRIKGIEPAKAQLSFICDNLSHLSRYAKSISTPYYRLLKSLIPGPYTFVLPASKEVPKILKSKKNTIGLRVPDHPVVTALIRELGNPILSSSLPGEMVEEFTDPERIDDKFGKLVDIVVDGGTGGMEYSTIIDLTTPEPVLLRQGAGEFNV